MELEETMSHTSVESSYGEETTICILWTSRFSGGCLKNCNQDSFAKLSFAAEERNKVAATIPPAQIAEAQKLAREWKTKR
jgi:hypothetical protein